MTTVEEVAALVKRHVEDVQESVSDAREDGSMSATEVLGIIMASRYALADAAMVWAGVQQMSNAEKHDEVVKTLDLAFDALMAWDWPGMTVSEAILKTVARAIWPAALPLMSNALINQFYTANPQRYGGAA